MKRNSGTGEENPPGSQAPQAPPCVLVIFGGAGDLTRRKLAPALYYLSRTALLPERFAVIGVGVDEHTDESYREYLDAEIREMVRGDFSEEIWSGIRRRIHYHRADFRDQQAYEALGELLREIDGREKTGGNILFYLATPPAFFAEIPARLAGAGLVGTDAGGWRRVIVEKPFGRDLTSAGSSTGIF